MPVKKTTRTKKTNASAENIVDKSPDESEVKFQNKTTEMSWGSRVKINGKSDNPVEDSFQKDGSEPGMKGHALKVNLIKMNQTGDSS